MAQRRKAVRLPRDIEHGCAWLTSRNYVRWQVTINGQTKVSENKDREKAFAAMRKAITTLQSAPDTQPETAAKRNPSIRDWCEEVLAQRSPHLEPTTRDLYRWVIDKWVLTYNDWSPLSGIDKAWISTLKTKLVTALFAGEMSRHHYRNIVTAIGLCMREAYDADFIDEDLSIHLRLKKSERKKILTDGKTTPRWVKGRRYVKNEDWLALIQSIKNHWLYGPLMLGSFTGMRTAEVAGLKWEHVHLDEPIPYLVVAQQIKRIRGLGLTEKCPKYNSVGEVGLVLPLIEMLRRMPHRSEFVFLNSRGNPLDVSVIDQVLKQKVQALDMTCLDGQTPVFTDFARRALSTERRRAGISAADGALVARHGVDMQEGVYEQETRDHEELRKDELAILGAIYAARLDAFNNRIAS